MKYFYIAETTCPGDITTCCGDYAIAKYLVIVQRVLDIIHFVVPMILILMATVGAFRLFLNPDDPQRKKWKSLINKFLAAVIVFFIPMFVNVLFKYTPQSFEMSGCIKKAVQKTTIMDNTGNYVANNDNALQAQKKLKEIDKIKKDCDNKGSKKIGKFIEKVLNITFTDCSLVKTKKFNEYVKYLQKIENGEEYQYLEYVDYIVHGEIESKLFSSPISIASSNKISRYKTDSPSNKKEDSSNTNKKSNNSSNKEKNTNNSTKGEEIAKYAEQFVGNPYVWGGTSLTHGADCSGFTLAVYNHFGIANLPHSASAQSRMGKKVSSLSEAQAGDLLFYQSSLTGPGEIGHVGIYDGKGNLIHASTKRTGIKISKADYKTVLAIRRFI